MSHTMTVNQLLAEKMSDDYSKDKNFKKCQARILQAIARGDSTVNCDLPLPLEKFRPDCYQVVDSQTCQIKFPDSTRLKNPNFKLLPTIPPSS